MSPALKSARPQSWRGGEHAARTGVTIIWPRGKKWEPVFAGWFAGNGFGDLTGTAWVEEGGMLGGLPVDYQHEQRRHRARRGPAVGTDSIPKVDISWHNALSGLLVDVKGGTLLLDGADIGRLSAHERVEAGLAHVPQGRELFPFMSVRENLELGAYIRAAGPSMRETLDWLFQIFPIIKERLSSTPARCPGASSRCARSRAA